MSLGERAAALFAAAPASSVSRAPCSTASRVRKTCDESAKNARSRASAWRWPSTSLLSAWRSSRASSLPSPSATRGTRNPDEDAASASSVSVRSGATSLRMRMTADANEQAEACRAYQDAAEVDQALVRVGHGARHDDVRGYLAVVQRRVRDEPQLLPLELHGVEAVPGQRLRAVRAVWDAVRLQVGRTGGHVALEGGPAFSRKVAAVENSSRTAPVSVLPSSRAAAASAMSRNAASSLPVYSC